MQGGRVWDTGAPVDEIDDLRGLKFRVIHLVMLQLFWARGCGRVQAGADADDG